jgi:hypothetical protein
MAKKQSFADKLSKHKTAVQCPVCEEPIQPTLVLQPVASAKGAYRMREVRVSVCNCNRKEVYG